jgi:hypothetical protein
MAESPGSTEDYPVEDYPDPGGATEPDIGVLPDAPDDPAEAAAGAVVDDTWAEVLEDESPGEH